MVGKIGLEYEHGERGVYEIIDPVPRYCYRVDMMDGDARIKLSCDIKTCRIYC